MQVTYHPTVKSKHGRTVIILGAFVFGLYWDPVISAAALLGWIVRD